MEDVQALARRLDAHEELTKPDLQFADRDRAGAGASAFPAQYPMPKTMKYLKKIGLLKSVQPPGADLPAGVLTTVPFTDGDAKTAEDAAHALRWVDFSDWLASKVDLDDPQKSNWLKSIVPAFFEEREKRIREIAEAQTKYAVLGVNQPQSLEDLTFLYEVDRNPELRQLILNPIGPRAQADTDVLGKQASAFWSTNLARWIQSFAANFSLAMPPPKTTWETVDASPAPYGVAKAFHGISRVGAAPFVPLGAGPGVQQ